MNETRIECNSLFTKSVCVDDIANSVCFSVFFSPCVFRKSYTLSLIDTHSSAQWRKSNNSNSKTSSMNTFLVHFIQRFLSNDGNKIRSQFTFVHLGLHRRRLNALDTFFLKKKKSLSLAQRCIQLKKKRPYTFFSIDSCDWSRITVDVRRHGKKTREKTIIERRILNG